jgi:hypothetical protein
MGRAMVLTVKRMSEGRRKKYLHNIVPESGEDRRKALTTKSIMLPAAGTFSSRLHLGVIMGGLKTLYFDYPSPGHL